MFWFLLAVVSAGIFFADGIAALLRAWSLPEYSHGPLIPVLSGLLFLRQLKQYPPQPGVINDRWVGVVVIVIALAFGALGRLANIPDLVAYGLIIWVGGLLLVGFGWRTGRHFWPPVLHLVYMLPLPDTFYYKMSTTLQLISSELGVWLLGLFSVPVFLDGNIIDLGVLKLHVAEACSGLRYLFPILSFSYIFAVLYKGPLWHKAVLLLSAAPITVFMNSVRIAVAGVLAQYFGVDWLEGFTHFFEGWVIFVACILILFGLAWSMLRLQRSNMRLADALDLNTDGLVLQAKRVGLVQPSRALIGAVIVSFAVIAVFQIAPERDRTAPVRERFAALEPDIGNWKRSAHMPFDRVTEITLAADDYHNVELTNGSGQPSVGLFMAWYADQSSGGVHSPEICLPGAGWEIAWLDRTNIASQINSATDFHINRAIIQKGETRMMVFYWFEEKGRKIAWDFAAKMWLIYDGVRTGRTDGGIVRLTTLIARDETDAQAEARLMDVLVTLQDDVPRFIP
ncbi:MAG: VPLPA-CTERM-specific exosortase XrtD [Yoonia sp.]|uniref:VPLPA-CTERM-specific exosortase XrtD n=1 Tax=Yoonia sp. TaxID=2212373 RepID=UPI00273D1988|nr:VPLPA-CTERM-specific exosortase XrtD [Yoonia sp.]MDP5087029.1 VPLPA-CTERM-specific exosortase XrtD [Yoonia sp.]